MTGWRIAPTIGDMKYLLLLIVLLVAGLVSQVAQIVETARPVLEGLA